jgi:hypothetical protein
MLKQLMSYKVLVPLSLILGLAPFFSEPHLFEKSRMLMNGTLTRPLDIFDLFWHSWPLALLGFRAGRDLAAMLMKGRRKE